MAKKARRAEAIARSGEVEADGDGRAGVQESVAAVVAGDEVRRPPGELLAFGVGLAEKR